MTSRTISKQLAAMEDIAQGVGKTTQSRGGALTSVTKVDVAFAVETVLEMQNLDVAKYRRARVFSSDALYVEYMYDPNAVSGITSTTGSGRWVQLQPTFQNLNLSALSEYADDSAAGAGGLVAGDLYRTATGEVRIKL